MSSWARDLRDQEVRRRKARTEESHNRPLANNPGGFTGKEESVLNRLGQPTWHTRHTDWGITVRPASIGIADPILKMGRCQELLSLPEFYFENPGDRKSTRLNSSH